MPGDPRQDPELDLLLDAALATYIDSEPSPSLTPRILAATRDLDRRRSVRWLPWAVPALAALLLAVFLALRIQAPHIQAPHTTSPVAARPHPLTSRQSPAVASVEAPPLRLHRSLQPPTIRADAIKNPPLPRLEVFPTPTPLSPGEQALVVLVNRNSRDSRSLAQQITRPDPQGQPIEPLRIAAIHIPPLNPPDNDNN
jgi:hypothetical protein